LKQRYGIHINFPYRAIPLKPAGVPLALSSSSQKKASVLSAVHTDSKKHPGDGVAYDPLALARRDPGWNQTLERVLDLWLRSVYKESLPR